MKKDKMKYWRFRNGFGKTLVLQRYVEWRESDAYGDWLAAKWRDATIEDMRDYYDELSSS